MAWFTPVYLNEEEKMLEKKSIRNEKWLLFWPRNGLVFAWLPFSFIVQIYDERKERKWISWLLSRKMFSFTSGGSAHNGGAIRLLFVLQSLAITFSNFFRFVSLFFSLSLPLTHLIRELGYSVNIIHFARVNVRLYACKVVSYFEQKFSFHSIAAAAVVADLVMHSVL